MSHTDPDPLPGDFDEELADIDPADVQFVESSSRRRLVLQVTVEGEDAAALERIAHDRGEQPGDVVRELIRAASNRTA